MERIKVLLNLVIEAAKQRGLEDVEISARVMLASIEKDMIDEFAEQCEQFTERKVIEMMMQLN